MGVGYKMYIRNITNLLNEMLDGEQILVNYKSGKQSTIKKTDKWETINADLQVTRIIGTSRCIVLIDVAEVESIILQKGVF